MAGVHRDVERGESRLTVKTLTRELDRLEDFYRRHIATDAKEELVTDM